MREPIIEEAANELEERELADLELSLVGGGQGDICLG